MTVSFSPEAFGLVDRALAAFAPPPDLKPSEWAERSVYIPSGSAIPGLIRFDNAPYQREPLDMTVNPECYRITLEWSAQVGKTTVALCAQSYRIAVRPQSQIMMQPSEGDLLTWLETKFNPLVDANEELERVIAKPRGRKGVNNTRMKSYRGRHIMFAWSGSPKTQRGRSAPFIVADETDGYDRTAEGHPVSLLWQRAATYGDERLLLEISTPTIRGLSYIDAAFEEGDRRRFRVGCPHCGTGQVLVWANVQWQKNDAGEHLPETAYYLCPDCGVPWSDSDRVSAIRNAEAQGFGWVAERAFRGHASYHLSELYSCFRPLADVVRSFLEKKAAGDLQTFVNVSLAEPWEEDAERVASDEIMARSEEWGPDLPEGVAVITAGVDMQEDRLEVELVGWGLGEESWSLDYSVFWGDPLKEDVWEAVFAHLRQEFRHPSGAVLKVAGAAFDTGGSGGLTQAAYEQLRGKQRAGFFAVKGAGGWNRPVVSAPKRTKSGKRGRSVMLFTLGVNDAKLTIMRRLQIAEPGPGCSHFPNSREPEFFAQITAEKLVTKFVRGFPFREWHKTRERNEALDCRVYAYAALKIVNPNIAHRASRLAPAEGGGDPPEETAGDGGDDAGRKPRRSSARRRQRRRRRGSNGVPS